MRIKPIMSLTCLLVIFLSFLTSQSFAQNKTINGRVTDQNGTGVPGVTVTVRGTTNSTQTAADGTYRITAQDNAVLVFTSVGYVTQEISTSGRTNVDVNFVSSAASLNEVVVIGYGTARRRDLTGSIGSVQAKDFNKGIVVNPDQLIQGKVAGLQITNSSGQPGAATITKIRGNNSIRSGNTPLYVIDGVPLDGRNPRPGGNSGIGTTPDVNPLNFINPNDIASIDVLKDASASAIYGSRGANGVILVTTKKGSAGQTRIEAGASYGISNVMRRIKVLNAADYRAALKSYSAPLSDSGATVDPLGAILHKNAPTQTYNVAFSGGSENGRYRASLFVQDQQGLVRKSSMTKYVANFNGQYLFLDKTLSFDYNVTAANVSEKIAPISNDAGSAGNLISLGLIWNPTLQLTEPGGLYNQANPSGQVNPLAESDAYNDKTSVTEMLASFAGGYKITQDLQYKMLYGINYGTGQRWQEVQGWLNAAGTPAGGQANIANTQLLSQIITHTLNYTKQITSSFNLNAVVGYEYWNTSWKGNGTFGSQFDLNQSQANINKNYHYYDNMSDAKQGNLRSFSFFDPTVEIQSYFARAVINIKDKYLLTATFRSDGSSKFGSNNKYAYFPSIAAAWNLTNEDFLKNGAIFNTLKLRVGYGKTGNQEFNPVDAALPVAAYTAYNQLSPVHYANPDLKWETVESIDVGLDYGILHNHIYGYIDYFSKKTINPILNFVISQPTAGTGTVYKNLDGVQAQKAWITNKGVEFSIGADVVQKRNFSWTVNANFLYVKNQVVSDDPSFKSVPFIKNTGALHGQGTSNAYAQVIAPGQPIDVYYLKQFQGYSNGIGQYSADLQFSGDPNPDVFVGFSTELSLNKWSLTINTHGAFGNKIYNNTLMSVLNVSNIIGGRNIASSLVGNGESPANFITPSTRFLESGNYMKLGNATLAYRFGNVGNSVKNLVVYVSGSNLFVITKYSGFDPEVNVDKNINGIPSLGIDYIGYPTARVITVGLNFSL